MSTDARWSEPIQTLLDSPAPHTCDVLIIGSGYGGSFAAREIAEHAQVWVMERGKEYALGEFPEDIGALPGHVRFHRPSKLEFTGKASALFDFRRFEDVSVLLANGLGGGSLINAGVAYTPDASVFDEWGGDYARDPRRSELLATIKEVAATLQAAPLKNPTQLKKHRALVSISGAPKAKLAPPVPLTIAQEERINLLGLHQKACINCGNCVTGCNVGAKNTLVSHVIPEAVARGATFYTGATARRVQKCAENVRATGSGRLPRWTVEFSRTDDFRGDPESGIDFRVHAHTVIIAAGSLGSTELLLRSRPLPMSPALGQGFSTNGDQMAMAWGMKEDVNGMSMPCPEDTELSRDVGPTITGAFQAELVLQNGKPAKALIQDGAIPSALAQAVVALGTSLSFAHRFTRDDLPGAANPHADLLATPPDIGRHALLLLAMGRDTEKGAMRIQGVDVPSKYEVLAPEGSRGKPVRGRLDIRWEHDRAMKLQDRTEDKRPAYEFDSPVQDSKPADRLFLEALDDWLENAAKDKAMQGADLLGNPLWQPLPRDFSMLTGSPPRGLLTVHPLGGCGIAGCGKDGVVNEFGAVFCGADDRFHDGLHVLDGAIVPRALGVNPFLTIAALSVIGARHIVTDLRRHKGVLTPQKRSDHPVQQPCVPALRIAPAAPICLGFEERLQGAVANPPDWLLRLLCDKQQASPDLRSERQWVVVVKTRFDLHKWLANPSMEHEASLQVYFNPMPHAMTVRDEAVRVEKPVLSGRGTISLLALDSPTDAEATSRLLQAYCTYSKRRTTKDIQRVNSDPWEAFKDFLSTEPDRPPPSGWKAFARAGRLQAHRRILKYRFTLGDSADGVYEATGQKLLAMQKDAKNIWDALRELDLNVVPQPKGVPAEMQLKVDLVDLVKQRRLQVLEAPNTPAAMVGLGAFAGLWLRALLSTHFWTFGSPNVEYMERLEPACHSGLRPEGPLGPECKPQMIPLPVFRSNKDSAVLDLQITRYDPVAGNSRGEHLLMIHGLAHGGAVFTTDTIGTRNMATHFLREGYVVWVLDHRLSNRLPYAAEAHTLDDVAEHDIPAAVRHVFGQCRKPIHVFAHCAGAGAFSMAALKGWLNVPAPPGDKCPPCSMVAAAIVHAVHPWVVPSASNQLSAALAAFFKDALDDDDIADPLVPVRDWRRGRPSRSLTETVIDRLAFSIGWDEEERAAHMRHRFDAHGGCAICNRMTFFYGREFLHQNISQVTHERLGSLFGVAGVEVFKHLYFILLRERLTDRHGSNTYLTVDNLKANYRFPVLFCHGRENKVFDPRSAVRSWHRLSLVREYEAKHFLAAPHPVHLWIVPDCGHMDFLFGQNAHRTIFKQLSDFFAAPQSFKTYWTMGEDGQPPEPPRDRREDAELTDHHFRTPRSLLTGPLVQLERTQGKSSVVIWFEQRRAVTSQPKDPSFVKIDDEQGEHAFSGWAPSKLEHIQSTVPSQKTRAPQGATLEGAGFFWTAALTRSKPQDFTNVWPQRIQLETEAPGATNPTRAADASASPGGAPRVRPGLGLDVFSMPIERERPDFEVLSRLARQVLRLTKPQEIPLLKPATPTRVDETAVIDYEERISPILDFSKYAWWNNWLAPDNAGRSVSWLATSCRWPGLAFERDAIDALAGSMHQHVTAAINPAEALVLLGDQIYVDATADVADTTELEERGAQRYRDAWQAPHTRRLLASVPTYMVLDDHEYTDNFGDEEFPWLHPDFRNGFEAAYAYQWRSTPVRCDPPRVMKTGVRGFWHAFEIGNIPAFAVDMRSERYGRNLNHGRRGRLMQPTQWNALTCWLKEQNCHRPKIICSGGVFGIFRREWLTECGGIAGADGWFAYPEATELARFIAEEQIQNVVFLAGDLHLSSIAELEFRSCGRDPVRALSVACSGWNATLPFANERSRDLALDAPVTVELEPGLELQSTAKLLSDAHRQFGKLTLECKADRWELEVSIHGAQGQCLCRQSRPLQAGR